MAVTAGAESCVDAGAASAASVDEGSCDDGELDRSTTPVPHPRPRSATRSTRTPARTANSNRSSSRRLPSRAPDDDGPAASAASLGDEIDEDSCEDGELEPIEARPTRSRLAATPDARTRAASDGDETDEDSCEDGELEPIELLSDGPHPPGSAALIAGDTVPAASAAATSAATERRRHAHPDISLVLRGDTGADDFDRSNPRSPRTRIGDVTKDAAETMWWQRRRASPASTGR